MLVWASVAMADGNLVWKWPEEAPVRYHLETVVDAPQGRVWLAERNEVARATRQMLILDVTCRGTLSGKRYRVECLMDDAVLRGKAVPGEEALLKSIMEADQSRLKGAVVVLSVGQNGRIRTLDMQASGSSNARVTQIMENLRQMVRRAFSPLDVQLPKRGDDKGKKWSQKGTPMVMELMTNQGTSGGVVMKHQVSKIAESVVRIETTGRGTVAEGAMMEAGTSTMIHLTAKGRSQFNTAVGVMDWSTVETQASFSASNLASFSSMKPASHSSWAGRVDEAGIRLEPVP